jgi:hypothetical protein
MSVYYPPVEEHENVIKAALRVIGSTHYQRADDPHADAEAQYAEEQLALAARALVRAVDRKSADEQPIGWVETECHAGLLPLKDLSAPIERCIVCGKHDVHQTAGGRKWTNADAGIEELDA